MGLRFQPNNVTPKATANRELQLTGIAKLTPSPSVSPHGRSLQHRLTTGQLNPVLMPAILAGSGHLQVPRLIEQGNGIGKIRNLAIGVLALKIGSNAAIGSS